MNILAKLFCLHDWKTHTKETFNWTELDVAHSTKGWYKPITVEQSYTKFTEILICTKCGKIKTLEY